MPATSQVHAAVERSDLGSARIIPFRAERQPAGTAADPTSRGFYRAFGKRAFDLAAAFAMIPVIAPLLLALCAAIALDGGRPVYASRRYGRDGRVFNCWKLRTMRQDSERVLQELLLSDAGLRAYWYENFKLPDDPRITPIGRFLRKTSLDELPQILNVLTGEMSFVGPRPILLDELEVYGDDVDVYFSMTPGITGLWQVSGRDEVTYRERKVYNAFYRRKMSFPFDLALMVRTVTGALDARRTS